MISPDGNTKFHQEIHPDLTKAVLFPASYLISNQKLGTSNILFLSDTIVLIYHTIFNLQRLKIWFIMKKYFYLRLHVDKIQRILRQPEKDIYTFSCTWSRTLM